jgi:hypothetical protein
VAIRAAPGLTCHLQYVNTMGQIEEPLELGPQVTDAAGTATWQWQIAPSTPPGIARVLATCSNGLGERQYIRIGE